MGVLAADMLAAVRQRTADRTGNLLDAVLYDFLSEGQRRDRKSVV